MTLKSTFQQAKNTYARHPLNSWAIGIVCGLFIAALSLITLLSSDLYILIVPVLAIPFFFSFIMLHYNLDVKNRVTAKDAFSFFALYFVSPFRSSFRVIASFFKTLLIELVVYFVLFGIMYLSFSSIFGTTFTDNFAQLTTAISDMSNPNTYFTNIDAVMAKDNNMLLNLFYACLIPSSLLSVIIFFLFSSFSSFSIFFRLRIIDGSSAFIRMSMKNALKKKKWALYRHYFALNWPLFVLIIIGMVGGSLITLFLGYNGNIAITIGVSSGFVLSSLFFPFYFCNMQSLYTSYESDFLAASNELGTKMLEEAISQRNLSEEQIRSIQEALNKLKGNDPSASQSENTDEEDKEKDPPGSE